MRPFKAKVTTFYGKECGVEIEAEKIKLVFSEEDSTIYHSISMFDINQDIEIKLDDLCDVSRDMIENLVKILTKDEQPYMVNA